MNIDFTADVLSGLCSLDVTFTISSDDDLFDRCEDGVKYLLLDFGDGEYSTSLSFIHKHIYSSIGIYSVILYVSDTYISFDVIDNFVSVLTDQTSVIKLNYIELFGLNPILTVNYNTLFCNKLAIFTIDIDDTMFLEIKHLLIDFGDGTYSKVLSKTQYTQYRREGEYTVTLYISKTPIYFIIENDIISIINTTCIFSDTLNMNIIHIDDFDFNIDCAVHVSPMSVDLIIDISDTDFNKINYMRVDFGNGTIINTKQKEYSNQYVLDIDDDICKFYDITVYVAVLPINNLTYTKSVTKSEYVKVINSSTIFSISPDAEFGWKPFTVNFKILIDYIILVNCIKYILIDFGDGEHIYCENTLDFTHTYLNTGTFIIKAYVSYYPILYSEDLSNINSECTISFTKNIIVKELIFDCSVSPLIGLNPTTATIYVNIDQDIKPYIKYILIDFGDGYHIYSQQIKSSYSHTYLTVKVHYIDIYISNTEIDYEIKDYSGYVFNIDNFPDPTPLCRKIIYVDECKDSNSNVKKCSCKIEMKHILLRFISDMCPCEGFIPFTVTFTIVTDPNLFQLANFLLFDFGDGTYSTQKSVVHIKTYSTIGVYTPIIYMSYDPIVFNVVNNEIIVEDSDYISKYIREEYVIAMDFKVFLSPETQTKNIDSPAEFNITFSDFKVIENPGKCNHELIRGNPWLMYRIYAIFDFGDGEISEKFLTQYSHKYSLIGTYNVKLYLSIVPITYSLNGTTVTIENLADTISDSGIVIISSS